MYYLFNLSGHSVPPTNNKFDVIVNRDYPNIPPFPEAIRRQAVKLVDSLPQDVLERGDFEVILPGMTPLAAAVIAVIESRRGALPCIRFAVKQPDGTYRLSGRIDLQQIRAEGQSGK